MKRYLATGLLLALLCVTIALGWLLYSESGLQWAYRKVETLLPGELHSQQQSGSLGGGFMLQQIEYRDEETRFSAQRVTVDWNPWTLLLARIDIRRLEAQQLEVRLPDSPDGSDGESGAGEDGPPQLQLPLELRLQALGIDRLQVQQGDMPVTLQELDLRATGNGGKIEIENLAVDSIEIVVDDGQRYDFGVDLAGIVDTTANFAHDLAIDWHTSLPTGEVIENNLHLQGDLDSIRIRQQTSGPVQAKLDLELQDMNATPTWQAGIVITGFDTAGLDAEIPPLSGNLELNARGDLQQASASLKLDAESADLGPFRANIELLSLEPERLFDGVQVSALQVDALDGRIDATGTLFWAPEPSWESELSARAIDPGTLFAEWPGTLDGEVSTRGRLEQGELSLSAEIRQLRGKLRGYPLTLDARVDWQDDALAIESARLNSGDTRIQVNGRVADEFNLEWSLQSGDLAELYPAAQGRLVASGRLGGKTGAPVVEAHFEGNSIHVDEYAIESVDGDVVLDLLDWRRLVLQLEAQDLVLQQQQIQSLDLAADRGNIDASLVATGFSAEIGAEGELHEEGWRGKLVRADIDTQEFDNWKLQQAAVLELSTGSLSSDPICLRSGRDTEICAALNQLRETWKVQLELVAVPLKMFQRWTPPELELDGVANASADLQYSPDTPLLGDVSVVLPGAIASYALQADEIQVIDYRHAGVDLLLEPAQLQAKARLEMTNGDRVEVSALLPGADLLQFDPQRQTLQANATVNARNWQLLNTLLPQVDILGGDMDMRISASGALTLPKLQIDGRLIGGAIYLPQEDLTIEQIEADFNSNELESVEYRFSATSAAGRVAIQGNTLMNRDDSWPSKLSFDLSGIDLSALPPHWSGPDLRLGGRLQAKGELEIDIGEQGIIGRPVLQVDGRVDEGIAHLLKPDVKLEQLELELRGSGNQGFDFDGRAFTSGGSIAILGNTLLDPRQGWPTRISFKLREIELLEALEPWIKGPLTVDGRVNADGEFNYRAPDHLLGELRVSSNSGRLLYPLLEKEAEEWDYSDALVVLKLQEDGIKAASSIEIGDTSSLSADVTLPQARALALDFENQALRGNTRADFEELNLIQLLFPEIDQLEGAISLDMMLAGSLVEPQVNARASLPLGSFKIPRLGLHVEQLTLLGESRDWNRFDFRVSALSGDGHLSVNGSSWLEPGQPWKMNLRARGADFEVSRTPEAHVLVTPDLRLSLEGRAIYVEGDLLLPYARLEPVDISTATQVSRDTVIIGGDNPVEERWSITTRVNLELGEQVSFDGFGFEASFGGRLRVEDRPGELSTGTGEITILEGRYRAYGQRLEIERGRVLFSGGALDNPGLDLRAQRVVDDVTVGLDVGGRLQDPEIELFSIPAMGETDMLSYLLFGRRLGTTNSGEGTAIASAAVALGLASSSFLGPGLGESLGFDEVRVESNSAGDQASLVVGRYLSPRMYVSYGVGLVESLNSLNLRYQLADKWHLEAETGTNTQSMDLLFTIER